MKRNSRQAPLGRPLWEVPAGFCPVWVCAERAALEPEAGQCPSEPGSRGHLQARLRDGHFPLGGGRGSSWTTAQAASGKGLFYAVYLGSGLQMTLFAKRSFLPLFSLPTVLGIFHTFHLEVWHEYTQAMLRLIVQGGAKTPRDCLPRIKSGNLSSID